MIKWITGRLFNDTDKELTRLRRIVEQTNLEIERQLESQRAHIARIRKAAFDEVKAAGATPALQEAFVGEMSSAASENRRLAGEADALRRTIETGEQTSRELSVLLADAKQLATMNAEKTQRPPAERRELEQEIETLSAELGEQLTALMEARPGLREAVLQAVPKAKLYPQKATPDEMTTQVDAAADFLGREVAGYFSRTNETILALRRAIGLSTLANAEHVMWNAASSSTSRLEDLDASTQELVRALHKRDLMRHLARQGLRLPPQVKADAGMEEDQPQQVQSSKSKIQNRGVLRDAKLELADEVFWDEQATAQLLAVAAAATGEGAAMAALAEKFASREECFQARAAAFRARILEARTDFWQDVQGKIADIAGADALAPFAARFEELDAEQEALIEQVVRQDEDPELPVKIKPDAVGALMLRRDALEEQTFTELMNRLRSEDRGAYDQLKALQDQSRKDQRKDEQEVLNSLIPEVFAVVWEASRRTTGLRPYDVQLLGGIVLHEGKIAEMKTGEGKTLVAVAPLTLNGLTARGAHLCTVNEYLVKRDSDWMGPIYKMLGLSVGAIMSGMAPWERKDEYRADITYGVTAELGFDYLRDNITTNPDDVVQRPHNYCIVDEVDNILIDEARTPLIISGASEGSAEVHERAARFAKTLRPDVDYEVDEKTRSAVLTDEGISRAESFFQVENLYHPDNFQLVYGVDNALKAHALFKRDKDYVLWQEGKVVSAGERLNPKLPTEVVIVDEFTGRLMHGRRYSEGLHEAIEAKEGIRVQSESQTFATITIQNYFRLYPKLAGMTGTAATEAEEFFKIYKLEVLPIPTHRPMIRLDNPDRIYRTEGAKFRAVAQEIKEMHEQGRPVLVGTVSIEKSEELSKMLDELGLAHSVLNAKQHEREASIVAQAGQRGVITIATNMAGRGTDIILGFGVNESGGLHIIGTERHESRRIDNQLRGRAGRQGDNGSSRFYVSVEDEIMRRSGVNQNLVNSNLFKNLWEEDMPIEHSMISRSVEQAQVKMEGFNFDTRKHLVEYDDEVNKQREFIYNDRRFILGKGDPRPVISEMINDKVREVAGLALGEERSKRDRGATNGYAEMFAALKETFPDDIIRRLLRSILTARLLPLVEEGDAPTLAEEAKQIAREAYEGALATQLEGVDEKLKDFYHVGDVYYETAGQGTLDYSKLTRTLGLPIEVVNQIREEEMDYEQAQEYLFELIRQGFEANQRPRLEKLEEYLDAEVKSVTRDRGSAATTESTQNQDNPKSEAHVRALLESIDANYPLSPLSAARYVEAESGGRSSMMGSATHVVEELQDQLQALYEEVEKTLGDVFIETNLQIPLIAMVDNRLPRSVYRQIEEQLGLEGLEQVENTPVDRLPPDVRNIVKDAFVRWQESDLMLRVIDYLWTRHLTTMEGLRHSIGLQAYGQKDPLVQYRIEAYELFEQLKTEIRQLVVLNVLLLGAKAEAARAVTRPATMPQPARQAAMPTGGDGHGKRMPAAGNGKVKPNYQQARAQQQAANTPVAAGKAKIGRNDPCFCGSGKKYKHCHGR